MAQQLETLQRGMQAVELHISGLTYRQIADKLGFSSGASGVQKAIDRALRAIPAPAVEQMRAIDGERLEGIIDAHWPMRHKSESAKILIQALERHARLFGLDAPVKAEITGQNGGPIETRDASIAYETILERLARLADAATVPVIDAAPDGGNAIAELGPAPPVTEYPKSNPQ